MKTLWLVFPVDSQEIHGDASHHDSQANTADHKLRVEGKDQQEGPEQQVNHWPHQAHLEDEGQCDVRAQISTVKPNLL